MNYQIEEQKLKELRHYHQKDCNEFLFRNEALKKEISRLPFNIRDSEMKSLSAEKVGHSDYKRSKDESYDVAGGGAE